MILSPLAGSMSALTKGMPLPATQMTPVDVSVGEQLDGR